MLSTALITLAARISAQTHGGRVRYERAGLRGEFSATFGRALEETAAVEPGTTYIGFGNRDFMIEARFLERIGVAEPQPGDRVTVLDGPDAGQVYEALPVAGGLCWRSCDPRGVLLRIHTKLVAE